ncbi:DUF3987 domain-containing protein [Ferrimicrobium acidiphilum]|uniref:DUF3987 domain-containing protein n=1 Tax=Ferrimicrobium acidiphilum TaxID=121039 RepID=UPI0023F4D625|nr:DUF3987 domain-containing protein [Ferrimicrobium acidiphilum]
MSALQKVLGALSDHGSTIKPNRGQYLAQCPAHDDHNPSLSAAQGDKGVLLHCFAGCQTDAILDALGLTPADLSDDAPDRKEKTTPKPKEVVAIYDYQRAVRTLSYQVVRYEPKDFRQRRPDGHGGWIWNLKGLSTEDRELPFMLPELAEIRKEQPDRPLAIAEGEQDCLALWKQGISSTCNAMGAGKWKDGHSKAVIKLGFTDIVIIADRDDPGKAHALAVRDSLLKNGYRGDLQTVIATCDDGCKDPADLIAHHGEEWTDQLGELVAGGVTTVTNCDTWPLTRENSPEKCHTTVTLLPEVSHLLPRLGILGEFSNALAAATQVDLEFALASALATVGLPVGLSVNVEVRSDWIEPAILQCLLIAPPSERKSPVLGVCMDPIYEAEREAREQRKAQIASAKAIEAELELEKANARKSGGYRDACERLENHTIPNEFRAILGKATAEALEVLAARQGERLARIAVVSDEGGAVFGDLGRYQNSTNWELLLAGYDGRRYSSERLSRASVLVDELRIPLFVMLQPSAWDEVKGDAAASGRGVLSRLSPIRPRSLVGERFGFGAPISKVLMARWAQRLTELFAQAYASDESIRLTLSPEAFGVWARFKDEVETELGDGTFERWPLRCW